MTAPIRLLIVDDHPVVRDGLRAVLSTQPDFAVIGEAGDGVEAVRQAEALRPDVVLLDLELPALDGVEVLAQLRALRPELPVIVFTAFDTDERILGAIQAGARGYLLKGAPRDQVFNAVRAGAVTPVPRNLPIYPTRGINSVRFLLQRDCPRGGLVFANRTPHGGEFYADEATAYSPRSHILSTGVTSRGTRGSWSRGGFSRPGEQYR